MRALLIVKCDAYNEFNIFDNLVIKDDFKGDFSVRVWETTEGNYEIA